MGWGGVGRGGMGWGGVGAGGSALSKQAYQALKSSIIHRVGFRAECRGDYRLTLEERQALAAQLVHPAMQASASVCQAVAGIVVVV